MIVTSGGFAEGKSVRCWVVDWLLIQWLDWMGFLSSHPHTHSPESRNWEWKKGRGGEKKWRLEARRGEATQDDSLNFQVRGGLAHHRKNYVTHQQYVPDVSCNCISPENPQPSATDRNSLKRNAAIPKR